MFFGLFVPVVPYSNTRALSKEAMAEANAVKKGFCCCKIWKAHWILHQVAMVMEMVITLIFWVAYVAVGPDHPLRTKISFLRAYSGHLHPFVCLTIDFWLVHAPYKMRHTIFVWLVCSVYGFGVNMP